MSGRRVRVRGTSMLPGLPPGSRLLLSAAEPGGLRRGDLLLVRPLGGSSRPLLKRLVGLPGERLELRGARVFVDGRRLEEPYCDPRAGLQPLADRGWKLGRDEYVVLGDARDDSMDSRAFGPVGPGDILGAAACPELRVRRKPQGI